MRKNMFRILLLSAAMSLCLMFGGNSAFGQCGADGKQPCGKSKPITKKKPTVKPTVTKPTITKKTQTNTSLKSKLVGSWKYSEDKTWGLTYYSDNTGKSVEAGKVCATINFTLTGNILIEVSNATGKCEGNDDTKDTSRIEFRGNKLLFFIKKDDGTYSEDPLIFIRIK